MELSQNRKSSHFGKKQRRNQPNAAFSEKYPISLESIQSYLSEKSYVNFSPEITPTFILAHGLVVLDYIPNKSCDREPGKAGDECLTTEVVLAETFLDSPFGERDFH